MFSTNSKSSHNNVTEEIKCTICFKKIDNPSSNDTRQLYKLCTKYLHSGLTKEIVQDCELVGSFSDGDQMPLCGRCHGSAKELADLTQTLSLFRKRVSDMVLIFSLEILNRRGKNAQNEEAGIKLMQLDVSKLPDIDNDSWNSPSFTTSDEIASSEIQENIARVRCTDKEDNVAQDLDFKDIVEIELLTEAEQLPGSFGGPMRNTPCATAEFISPQENMMTCVTEIGNTLVVSESDTNEGIIWTTTGGTDQNASTEANASEIAVEDVIIGENIDLTKCKDRQPKPITERNEINMQNRISMPIVKLQKLRFQWKTNDNGENFIIVKDGGRSAKPNLLPKSKHILKKESQVSDSQTPEVLDTVQGLPVPSILPNQMASARSTQQCVHLPTAKKGKSAPLKKISVQKSFFAKLKSKQSGDSAKGNLDKNVFRCNVRKKIFLQKSYLLIHTRQHHIARSYKCLLCSQTFSQKNQLKTHQRFKHGNKTVKCSFCDKEVSSMGNLNIHLRTHTGEKPYNCTSCKMSFSNSSSLNTHLRIHTGEKPFKCDKCDYSGARLYQVTSHKIYRHSNKRSLKCRDCQKTFKTRDNVRQHYKYVHPNAELTDDCILLNN